TQRVMAQIGAAERWVREQRSFWRPIEAWSWRLAFSASLALALLFGYGVRNTRSVAAPEAPGVLVQQTDAFTVPVAAPPSSGDEVLMAIAERHHER
ncbi:MAG TPA: hypothetical protein VJO16_00555, partial [Candidatus Acidoferrum sp.]|nr:hypothetical protein [Candidatus Acidoferrum sp.]